MIESLSPSARRAVAVGIAVLVGLTVLSSIVLPLITFLSAKLAALESARFGLARMEALAEQPVTPRGALVPKQLYIEAKDEPAALAALTAALSSAASAEGLQLQVQPILGGRPRDGIARAAVIASGDEPSMLRFINSVERGKPAARFGDWTLAPASQTSQSSGALVFRATVLAAWGEVR